MAESGPTQQTPIEEQGSEGILEMKQKITKLETNNITSNAGFPSINQNILLYLDHESQMAFRQVCQSWKEQVDVPLFWIKKLNLKSYPKLDPQRIISTP